MYAVNYVAVLVAAVAAMVIGYIWYGPLFGKMWMKESGMKDMKGSGNMAMTYAIQYVAAAVMAYVLAVMLKMSGTTDLMMAVKMAFWIWLGFIATTLIGSVLFEKKSWGYYLVNAGYHLVTLAVVAAVLVNIK
ncbi:MAG TPA: DUF1761 domain-containing protein [Gammaproteobacteria bacterium]|nr:DUF1761 domain-containing protein [Gammaproteobacteria bacterium]